MQLSKLVLAFVPCVAALVVPRYNGTYGVDMHIKELVDLTRFDNATGQSRRIMTSIFYPTGESSACKSYTVPYMTPATAAFEQTFWTLRGLPSLANTFASLEFELCSSSSTCRTRSMRRKQWPVVLFSPGLGAERVEYSAIAAALASTGYIVVTMDHPGQSTFIEYADGTTTLTNSTFTNIDEVTALFAPRVDDILLVLANLRNRTLLSSHLHYRQSQVFALGHSFGGAAGAQAMYQDHGITAGINLDGLMFGSVVSNGITDGRPFMIFEHEGNNVTNKPSWAEFKSHVPTDRYLEIELLNSQHRTFTDYPLLADVAGLRTVAPDVVALLGSVPGGRVIETLTMYVDAWFRFGAAPEHPPQLLTGPSESFTEVEFTSKPLM